jgi:hypothetical protein
MSVFDLVRYNDVVRGLYLERFAGLLWGEVVKPRGASYDSMRIKAEKQVINIRTDTSRKKRGFGFFGKSKSV